MPGGVGVVGEEAVLVLLVVLGAAADCLVQTAHLTVAGLSVFWVA